MGLGNGGLLAAGGLFVLYLVSRGYGKNFSAAWATLTNGGAPAAIAAPPPGADVQAPGTSQVFTLPQAFSH